MDTKIEMVIRGGKGCALKVTQPNGVHNVIANVVECFLNAIRYNQVGTIGRIRAKDPPDAVSYVA